MAYRLKRSDRSIEAAVRRIVDEQADAALKDLSDSGVDRVETVHSARKHCKQLRALIRLIRPGFSAYAEANARLRALAAPLAVARDADVMIETHDAIVAHCPAIDASACAVIRRGLVHNRKALDAVVDLDMRLAAFAEDLEALRADAAHWELDGDGFDAVAQGLARAYRRGRKAMKRAAGSDDPDDYHDWRKAVKYHWYHTRLLGPMWPAEMAVHIEAAKQLGELLGHHHDFAVLDRALAAHPDEYGGEGATAPFRAALAQRTREVAQQALADGRLLLSEPPDVLTARWRGYWRVWRDASEGSGDGD